MAAELNEEDDLLDDAQGLDYGDSQVVTHEEVEFLEKYCLSVDRAKETAKVWDEDSLDYWYWSLLDCQTKEDKAQFTALSSKLWDTTTNDFFVTDKIQKLLFRQSLLDFDADTADEVKTKVSDILTDVKLNHKIDPSVKAVEEKALPTTLQLTTSKLLARKFAKVATKENTIEDIFTPAAGIWLADKIRTKELDAQQSGDLLELLSDEPPEIPYLLTALQQDFGNGTTFGERKIHEKLTKETMQLLGKKMPSLYQVEAFLIAFCRKLRKISDVNLNDDMDAKGEYLRALLQFAKTHIKDNHMSLKALIYYNYLRYLEQEGKGDMASFASQKGSKRKSVMKDPSRAKTYDKNLILEYLSLPKQKNVFDESNQKEGDETVAVDLDWMTAEIPELLPIVDDEPYIRRAVSDFFLKNDKPASWKDVINKRYLHGLVSEVNLLAGRGNEKQVAGHISTIKKIFGGDAYKKLRNRVDMEFTPGNRRVYDTDSAVSLDLFSKNNSVIQVNVYRIASKNYFKTMLQDVPEDINLSGSSPIVEITIECDERPIRRVCHHIEIPQLAGQRGIFAIDLIGNGVSLRALVRKGELRYICDQDHEGAGGYVFKVFNERNELIENPCIWMEGKNYMANDEGLIILPFAEKEDKETLIILEDLTDNGSATLQTFKREAPSYKLECGMYIDREQLRNKLQADVLIRANLYMNQEIISLDNLEDIQLKLVCEDNSQNVRTRIAPIKLVDSQETVYNFTVPTEVRAVECLLSCRVDGHDLISKQIIQVNGMNDTMAIADMFIFPSGAAGYVLACVGKNGEGHANQKIDLKFNHRFFKDPIEHSVQTDENGHIYLGRLYDVKSVEAYCGTSFVFGEQTFELLQDAVNLPRLVNRALGSVVRIPFIADSPRKPPALYLYDSNYIQSFPDNVKYENYYILINDLPAGDYILHVRDVQTANVEIYISGGVELSTPLGEYVVSQNRVLQLSEDMPLNVVNVTGSRTEGYEVSFKGTNDLTRVHLLCCTHNPCFNIFGFLSSPNCPPDVIRFTSPYTKYSDCVPLDPEYDYVVKRKDAKKYPGNLLNAPTTISNAWSDQNVKPRMEDPLPYRKPVGITDKLQSASDRKMENFGAASKTRESDTSSLEFLGEQSRLIYNLVPEVKGDVAVISIPPETYAQEHNLVQVLVVDDDNTALRNIILEETEVETKKTDVRLEPGLNSEHHYAETRRVIGLASPGDEYVIQDFETAEYEPYETLEEPYNLFRATSTQSDGTRDEFVKFQPLIDWLTLSNAAKLEFYDAFACHEVNFFLCKKDPQFFDEVIVPGIASKVQKTFMDLYLIGGDLSKFVELHNFQKLNALEKILLCSVVQDADLNERTLNWITECAELENLVPKELDRLFNMGINSRQLGVDELDKQMKKLERRVTSGNLDADLEEGMGDEENVTALDAIKNSFGVGDKEEYVSMTRPYQETCYYKIDVTQQTADLISPNRYWADYASYLLLSEEGGFVSQWYQLATSSLNEMLLALAVLDLPLDAEEPRTEYLAGGSVKIIASLPVIIYVRELVQTEERTSALAVSTNYFDPFERTHMIDGEIVDKFLNEFTVNKVYGCRMVVTNVSSVEQHVEILAQIPTGSIPCGYECFKTKCWLQTIKKFGTYKLEFFFYWPDPGTFAHFPVHINKNGKTVGFGESQEMTVTIEEPAADTSSWKYISNLAENEDVLAFLKESPEVLNVNLEKICWRCKDPEFFESAVDILRDRKIFNHRVWAYSIVSDQKGVALGEYLAWNEEFRKEAGPCLESELISIDAEATRDMQIIEFWPYLNARAHETLSETETFRDNYWSFLNKIAFSSTSVDTIKLEDKFLLCAYLLLRNKFGEAKELFEKHIDAEEAQKSIPMVYDYFKVYLAFLENTSGCEEIAQKYVDSTLPESQKKKWSHVLETLAHAADITLGNDIFLEEEMKRLKKRAQPYLHFKILEQEHAMHIKYRNITELVVNFYITDLEVLFSAHPFQETNTSYKLILPNENIKLDLNPEHKEIIVELPMVLKENNTIIEVVTETLEVVQLFNDNKLDVQLAEDEGELRVLHKESGDPIQRAYCKVYAQSLATGKEEFFKDGYTDIRGRFDYRTLSTDQLRQTKRLAILIATEEFGSVIREVDIPLAFISQAVLPGLDEESLASEDKDDFLN